MFLWSPTAAFLRLRLQANVLTTFKRNIVRSLNVFPLILLKKFGDLSIPDEKMQDKVCIAWIVNRHAFKRKIVDTDFLPFGQIFRT